MGTTGSAQKECFDLVYCFGILHRVENPLGLLRVLSRRTVDGGAVLVETYGVGAEDRNGPAIRVFEPGEVYARDGFVYCGFGDAGLERLARIAGFSRAASLINVEVDGHPRIIGRLRRIEAPGQHSQQPLHKTTISGHYCRSGFVELSGSSSAPIRPGPIGGLAPRAC